VDEIELLQTWTEPEESLLNTEFLSLPDDLQVFKFVLLLRVPNKIAQIVKCIISMQQILYRNGISS
jgi:hypothetical protein